MPQSILLRLLTLTLLLLAASLQGCICLWREVHVEKPDPLKAQMVEVASVSGTSFTLKDGRIFVLAGVSLEGFTPEQVKSFETDSVFRNKFLLQETQNGHARLIYALYSQNPDFENFFIPIIPIFVDFYPNRYDVAAWLINDGLVNTNAASASNASPVPYPKRWFKKYPPPEIPQDKTYAQYLNEIQERARQYGNGIFKPSVDPPH